MPTNRMSRETFISIMSKVKHSLSVCFNPLTPKLNPSPIHFSGHSAI